MGEAKRRAEARELAASAKVVEWLRAHPDVKTNTFGAGLAISLFAAGEDATAYAFLETLAGPATEQGG